jgi:hypothetical protein
MLCISGGKGFATSHAPSLWTGSIPGQAKLGVISGLWGDLASRVQGATVDGKKGWAVAV